MGGRCHYREFDSERALLGSLGRLVSGTMGGMVDL